jgi:hypothetical protein
MVEQNFTRNLRKNMNLKIKNFLYHCMNTFTKTFSSMEIDGITENEAKIKRTASSLNISGQKSVRRCDSTCNVSK